VAAWLTGLRWARTRRTYAGDVVAWPGWIAGRDTSALAAGSARATCESWCAGASLRDVQDYAGHKVPRITRRYDHSRDSLDRNAVHTPSPPTWRDSIAGLAHQRAKHLIPGTSVITRHTRTLLPPKITSSRTLRPLAWWHDVRTAARSVSGLRPG